MVLTPELKVCLESNGYYDLREVEGVICGLHNYMYTVGLAVDLDEHGLGRRYCFSRFSDAKQALEKFTDPSKHAEGHWIKCKGKFNGEPIDLLNPKLEA